MCYAERKKAGSKIIIWCHPTYDFSHSTFWESENQGRSQINGFWGLLRGFTIKDHIESFDGDGNIL